MCIESSSAALSPKLHIKGCIVLWLIAWICTSTAAASQLQAELGGDFSLVDQDGGTFSLQQLRDHIVLLYFGYTSCPDVCPTELGKMASVLNSVPQPQKDMLRGLFVTVDPDRDSRTRLKEYLSYFDDRIIGLTGNREQIDRVVDQYHASYRIRKEGARVIVNHSSNLYLIDQRGQVVTMVPFGMSTDHLTQLVDRLLDNPSSSLENN